MQKLHVRKFRNFSGEPCAEIEYRLTLGEALNAYTGESWLKLCIRRARRLPDGWIKMAVLEKNGCKSSPHYSPRPYVQGYGCDGSTGDCILLLAREFCHRRGLDFAALYAEAYGDRETDLITGDEPWFEGAARETVVPSFIDPWLVLTDLEDINYHSFVGVLYEALKADGTVGEDWPTIEETHERAEAALLRASPVQLSMFKEKSHAR